MFPRHPDLSRQYGKTFFTEDARMSQAANCELVIFDAGGGHRSAAVALHAVLRERGFPANIHFLNLQLLLEPLDLMKKLSGLRLEDFYNRMLRKGWTYGTPQMVSLLHAAIRFYHGRQVDLLEKHWRESRPAMVVSLIPHFNRAILQSLRRYSATVPFVTVMTDIADYPPHFWIERQDQYLICGSPKAFEQASAYGPPQNRIFSVSGMILHPRFYEQRQIDRRQERSRLGLDPDLITGIVLFGGYGSKTMLTISEALENSSCDQQLIFICGHNEWVRQKLHSQKRKRPCFVTGFAKDVQRFMHLADFFIGKPGPGSISEALAMRLPLIVESNARTIGQERYNTEWILKNDVGIVIGNWRRDHKAVEGFLKPINFSRYQSNASAIQNCGVFEVANLLQEILIYGDFRHRVPA
jgi:1,2-diacylglycerol 3-beta-galactosyltransferase